MNSGKLVISALRGGSGKTMMAVGIAAALRKRGISVIPFKKGPDYIDAGWLSFAAGRPCYNLDTFLISEAQIISSFKEHTTPETIAVIEGNRGLYDCIDLDGSTSTAELAKLLNAPVVLILDCTKTTRTMAAIILGLQHFDPAVSISGIILNRIAGTRHERILTGSIEHHCGIRVVGAVPKIKEEIFPERHMGLVPTPEHGWAKESIEKAIWIAEQYIDLDRMVSISGYEPQTPVKQNPALIKRGQHEKRSIDSDSPVIGIIKDSAFQFYYPENIAALIDQGIRVEFISPLGSETFPQVDALYIGGGFPETHAHELANNIRFRSRLKDLAQKGLPIYAECGGLIYLGQELILNEKSYPMAGVLPIVFGFSKKPQGHGYTIVQVERKNPFYERNIEFKGHEFHYSRVLEWKGKDADLVFNMKRGAGLINGKDGVCIQNVLATYTHIHVLGLPQWAEAMKKNAVRYKNTHRKS